MRSDLALFGVLIVALAVIVPNFASVASPVPFAYDEADYMSAGTRGFLANYLDQPSQSLPEFIRKGLELARDKARRGGMSEYIRNLGDITFYRHFHGPMYAYWIAACKAVGVGSEQGYRASGLTIHVLASIGIFWLFRLVFPELGGLSALVAALTFAMNRTALVSGTTITQHVMYSFFAILTQFAAALFLRTGDRRHWYATAALLALSFASVEIGFVLLIAVILSVLIVRWSDGWREMAKLFGRGAVAFAVTFALVWPKGVLELGFVKGYLYLAYMAVLRKTFSPIGPLALWGFKLKTYPFEFLVPLVAVIAATVLAWRLKYRRETLPFLLYTLLFIAVTMKVTAPFTHYHVSLLTSASVVVGIMFGELWRRSGVLAAGVALVVIVGSSIVSDIGFYREQDEAMTKPSFAADVLTYLQPTPDGTTVLAPYVLIPTLHYYRPELPAIGYDTDWTKERLVEMTREKAGSAALFCPESVCRQLAGEFGNGGTWVPLGQIADQRGQAESLFAIQTIQKR
jgi:hypothetical protein